MAFGGPSSGGLGDRAPCIFVGRAIQVVPGTGNLHFYTVLGTKSNLRTGYDKVGPKTIVDESRPAIAYSGLDNLEMYETYKIPGGAKIISSIFTAEGVNYGSDIKYDLAGIYSGVGGISPTSGPSQIMLWGYPVDSSSPSKVPVNNKLPLGPGSADECVRRSCVGTIEAEKWELCVQNPENSRSILLTVESAASGLITSMRDIVC